MDDTQKQYHEQMNEPIMPEQQQQQQFQYQNQPPMYQQAPPYQNQPQPPYYQNQPPQGQVYQGQPYQQGPLIVVQQQPGLISDPNLFLVATGPVAFYCPKCQKQQISKTYPQVGAGTHIVAIALCFVTVLCCWIPYVVDSCQDTVHCCPECNIEVGRRRFINI